MPGVSISPLPSLLLLLLLLSMPPPSIPRRLTPLEKVQLLDGHNWYRASLPGLDSQGLPLPTAADMNMLEWDNDLEAIAQEWADSCPRRFGYRDCPSYTAWRMKVQRTFDLANIGQIILVYRRNLTGTTVDVLSALNKTYSMVSHYDTESRRCNTSPGACDSFTQERRYVCEGLAWEQAVGD
ncbi:venom allergen 3 homolog [Hemiscyllium ocellatum]|uniref:venom allergen 3 homolog n=1 Tax=Hemiscyllium ocellatum TaxID=170820 RepID=UPI002967459F|nr:venom allergen 3 homolog [Hemiscyllium ocellatum]